MFNFRIKKNLFYILTILLSLIFLMWGYKTLLGAVYPLKYQEIVSRAAKKYDVEEELIYAIIKAESGFDKNAESKAGACGLMQITPDTFEWLQRRTNSSLSKSCLSDPEVNINFGTMFISILRGKYSSDDIVLSAYNAGITTVERWLGDENVSEDGEELGKIPYKETRDYVTRVKQIKKIYKKLYFKGKKQ